MILLSTRLLLPIPFAPRRRIQPLVDPEQSTDTCGIVLVGATSDRMNTSGAALSNSHVTYTSSTLPEQKIRRGAATLLSLNSCSQDTATVLSCVSLYHKGVNLRSKGNETMILICQPKCTYLSLCPCNKFRSSDHKRPLLLHLPIIIELNENIKDDEPEDEDKIPNFKYGSISGIPSIF